MSRKKKYIKELGVYDVIHAPTKKIVNKLMDKFNELGLRWANGCEYVKDDDRFYLHKDKTCYRPSMGMSGALNYYLENKYFNFNIYTIDDLLDFNEPEFKRGEKVLVRDCATDSWEERIFITKAKGARLPYICVGENSENDFNEGREFEIYNWAQIKKKSNSFTRKQIAEALGVEEFEIVD